MRATLGAAIALGCLLALAPSAAAARSDPPVPRLHWKPCGDGVRCATAHVPLDHDRPHGRTIRLALAKLPAADRSRRIGTLFFNPGGPGETGVGYLRDLPAAAKSLTRRFDVVGFDPRGVGASRPIIDCVSDRELEALVTDWPAAEFAPTMAAGDRIAAGCRANTPRWLLDHVSTADVARDLDLLRQAVGDRRLTYLGWSYGTELGAVYATLFPGRARALALDGGVDPREYARWPLAFSRTVAIANEAALRRFFAFCAGHSGCPLGADAQAAYDALLGRLATAPISGAPGDPRVVDDIAAANAALSAMYAPELWPVLGDGLAQAASGDGAILQALSDSMWDRRPGGGYSNEMESYIVIRANDSRSPRRRGPYRRQLEAMLDEAPHFADAVIDAARRTLPIGEDAYRGRVSNPAGAPAVLVVGSTHDNAAPYAKARAMTRDLGNARLLTREGDGHTAYRFSPCVARHVNAYLIHGILPRAGTRCSSA